MTLLCQKSTILFFRMLKMGGQLYHFAPWQLVTNVTQKIQKTVRVQSYFRGDI